MDNKRAENTLKILNQMLYLHQEDNENHISLQQVEEEATEHFEDMLVAFKLYFEKLTSEDLDIIEFVNKLNRLAVKYLMEENKVNVVREGENNEL